MKYFCFAECTNDGRNIVALPCPFWNNLQDIPKPFFTLEDVENHQGFNSFMSETNKSRMKRAKAGARIRLRQLSRNHSQYLLVFDEDSEIFKLYMLEDMLKSEASQLRSRLAGNPIYKELNAKQNELTGG